MARLGKVLYSQQSRAWIIKDSLKEYHCFHNLMRSSFILLTPQSLQPSPWTLFCTPFLQTAELKEDPGALQSLQSSPWTLCCIHFLQTTEPKALGVFLLQNAVSEPFFAGLLNKSIDGMPWNQLNYLLLTINCLFPCHSPPLKTFIVVLFRPAAVTSTSAWMVHLWPGLTGPCSLVKPTLATPSH